MKNKNKAVKKSGLIVRTGLKSGLGGANHNRQVLVS